MRKRTLITEEQLEVLQEYVDVEDYTCLARAKRRKVWYTGKLSGITKSDAEKMTSWVIAERERELKDETTEDESQSEPELF